MAVLNSVNGVDSVVRLKGLLMDLAGSVQKEKDTDPEVQDEFGQRVMSTIVNGIESAETVEVCDHGEFRGEGTDVEVDGGVVQDKFGRKIYIPIKVQDVIDGVDDKDLAEKLDFEFHGKDLIAEADGEYNVKLSVHLKFYV